MRKFCAMSFFKLHSGFYLALHEDDIAERIAKSEFNKGYVIVSPKASLVSSKSTFNPSLAELYHFDAMTKSILRKNGEKCRLVFSTGKEEHAQIRLAVFLGCNMIMSHGFGYQEAFAALKPIHSLLQRLGLDESLMHFLRALNEAKLHQWIDFSNLPEVLYVKGASTETMDMEEYVHYARYPTKCRPIETFYIY